MMKKLFEGRYRDWGWGSGIEHLLRSYPGQSERPSQAEKAVPSE